MLNATRTSRKAVSHMKNQADEMAAQLCRDCRMAVAKKAAAMLAFAAALVLLTWLAMRW